MMTQANWKPDVELAGLGDGVEPFRDAAGRELTADPRRCRPPGARWYERVALALTASALVAVAPPALRHLRDSAAAMPAIHFPIAPRTPARAVGVKHRGMRCDDCRENAVR